MKRRTKLDALVEYFGWSEDEAELELNDMGEDEDWDEDDYDVEVWNEETESWEPKQ